MNFSLPRTSRLACIVATLAFTAGSSQAQAPIEPPSVNPPGGVSFGTVSVSMETATVGAEIRYTLNGTPATRTSPLYTGPFPLSSNTTVSAITVLGDLVSEPTTRVFTFPNTLAPLPILPSFIVPPFGSVNLFETSFPTTLNSVETSITPPPSAIQTLQQQIVQVRRRVRNPVARANQIRRLNLQIQRLRAQEIAQSQF